MRGFRMPGGFLFVVQIFMGLPSSFFSKTPGDRMLSRDIINEQLNIKESYELPGRLMEIVLDTDRREALFDAFLALEPDLSYDWFTDYYQQEQGDRETLKQDFTPDCLCELISGLVENTETTLDLCAGTGGLTIRHWGARRPPGRYVLEEVSARAVPVLLFNLAIRNMDATVIHGDSLTQETQSIYRISPGERYSTIETIDRTPAYFVDTVITNPPYSLKWSADKSFSEEERFAGFGLPPGSKADYAFILHGLSKIKPGGTMAAILPHGVLFRGMREGDIRRKLIESNLLHAVIGLPDKLFLNTGIPVCIVILKKHRKEKDVLIIDASKDYRPGTKQNTMEEEHIKRILAAYQLRGSVERYSVVVAPEEIAANEYNLNIPRYVDSFERPKINDDLPGIIRDIVETDREIQQTCERVFDAIGSLVADNPEDAKRLAEAMRIWGGACDTGPKDDKTEYLPTG